MASVVALIAIYQAPAVPSSRPTKPIWQSVIPRLVRTTRISIVLPTYLPGGLLDGGGGSTRVYAAIQEVTASRYEIELAATPNCHGVHACHFGTVAGIRCPEGTRLRGRPVSLARGQLGYFLGATCGANCGDAILGWNQRGVDYTITSKAGSLTELVRSANSAIVNGTVRRHALVLSRHLCHSTLKVQRISRARSRHHGSAKAIVS